MTERHARTDGPWTAYTAPGQGAASHLAPDETDPYGLAYGDWQDPYEHADDMCTGCTMCAPWQGKPYAQVRAERIDAVRLRRAKERDAAGS